MRRSADLLRSVSRLCASRDDPRRDLPIHGVLIEKRRRCPAEFLTDEKARVVLFGQKFNSQNGVCSEFVTMSTFVVEGCHRVQDQLFFPPYRNQPRCKETLCAALALSFRIVVCVSRLWQEYETIT